MRILKLSILLAALACLIASSAADAANRFAVCTTTCTWDGASTAIWSTSTGGATGASVPGAADAVILDAATCVGGTTCTITVNTNFSITTLTMGACTASTSGCVLDFSANNNSPSLTGFSGTGTGTRTLNMGSGTWTITNTGAVAPWDMTTITNLTFSGASATITIAGTPALSRTFSAATLTYGTINVGAGANGIGLIFGIGNPTMGTLNITAPNMVLFGGGLTYTITNAFNFAGTAFNNAIYLASSNNATSSTISTASGSPTMAWAVLARMTFTGGATFTATNSFDLKGNTGIAITGPSGGTCPGHIIGGWLLKRDFNPASNDNNPMGLDRAAC
jgi:hypothetical protein